MSLAQSDSRWADTSRRPRSPSWCSDTKPPGDPRPGSARISASTCPTTSSSAPPRVLHCCEPISPCGGGRKSDVRSNGTASVIPSSTTSHWWPCSTRSIASARRRASRPRRWSIAAVSRRSPTRSVKSSRFTAWSARPARWPRVGPTRTIRLCRRPAKRSPGSGWSKSWAEAHSRGSTSRRSGIWPIGRSRSR